jgi:hypothetical protein
VRYTRVQSINQSTIESSINQSNSGFLKDMFNSSGGFDVTMTAVNQDSHGL